MGQRNQHHLHSQQRWTRTKGMPFYIAEQLLQDPCQSDTIWLSSKEGLIRFSKKNKKAEVVQASSITHIETHKGKVYPVSANTLITWDCEKKNWKAKNI